MISFILALYCIFFLLLDAVLFFLFKKNKIPNLQSTIRNSQLPHISVLVAARNEEKNISDCLNALHKLTYPKEKLEILIGNDQSNDRTKEIVKDFIHDKPQFQLIDIVDENPKLKAKARVISQLAQRAIGEIYLITDADAEVPPDWVWGMLSPFEKNVGIVTGFTSIRGNTIFHHLQALDWIFALTQIKIASDLQIPVTTLGNNMAVSKEAYQATGGYENIPFSITEDFELLHQTLKKGYSFKNLIHPRITVFSKAPESFLDLLHQRKRWMQGAMQLPAYLVLLLFGQALFLPFLLIYFFFQPLPALVFLALKIALQDILIDKVLRQVKQTYLRRYLILYPFYAVFISLLLIIFYFLPVKVIWKGRRY